MTDALIEAGQSDALVEAIFTQMRELASPTNSMHYSTLRFTIAQVVDRLRAGDISDLVIRKCLCGDGFAEVTAFKHAEYAPAPPVLSNMSIGGKPDDA